MNPARCERSRQAISLRLDGALSIFEAALLDRHLRACPGCRAFAAAASAQTRMLRAAPPERLAAPVDVPLPKDRQRARALAVTLAGALAAAAAAAVLVLQPGASRARSSAYLTGPHERMLTQVASDVDGLASTEPASEGPGIDAVRGVFSLPV